MSRFARVAVTRPLNKYLDYRIPGRLAPWVVPGARCVVPLGRTRTSAFVVELLADAAVPAVREVAEALDEEPVLPADLVQLGRWAADYYHHPPGEVFAGFLPPACRATSEAVYRLVASPEEVPDAPRTALVARLASGGSVPASRFGAAELVHLDQLCRAGKVVREWQVRRPQELSAERLVRRTPQAPVAATVAVRARRQAQALELLERGELPVSVLRAHGISAAVLRSLEEKGWVVSRTPPFAGVAPAASPLAGADRPTLTGEQETALARLAEALEQGRFSPHLLQGVTGSGKTEVYLHAVEAALQGGRGAIVLVPEIALTPQLQGRFYQRFGDRIATLHSGLAPRERRAQWERVRRGRAPVVLGARSAVFAPVAKLGLVVVDEEHEGSYKQEDGFRYHAKHVALMRARIAQAVAVLGSATPDLESRWGVGQGRYRGLHLTRRVAGGDLPRVTVVDLRQEEARRRRRVLVAEPLREAVAAALANGRQALLFLNRRGFNPALVCQECAEALRCRLCSIALTVHQQGDRQVLLCHYCGARRPLPATCPACGGPEMRGAGTGTQQLAELAAALWPQARILRLDRDVARRGESGAVLEAFHEGSAEILVGTQMVAKGHHFPRLAVVGVVEGDQALHFPDFRAAERTFQLLTQVAGRAGRESHGGLAFVQTRNPHHPVIQAAAAGAYESFYRAEIADREAAGFPPFRRLAVLRFAAKEEAAASNAAERGAQQLEAGARRWGVELLGPAPAPIERVRSLWRYQLLLRAPGPRPDPLQRLLRHGLPRLDEGLPRGVRFHADVDPVSLL